MPASESSPPTGPLRSTATALLVMDCQPAVLSSIANSSALVRRIGDLADVARSAGVLVIHVRVALTDKDYQEVSENNVSFSRIARAGTFRDGVAAYDFVDDLAPHESDLVVRKTRVGAFSTTTLGEELRERGIDTLILTGVRTGGVILSTVRDAADRDYRLIVAEDGVADSNQAVHTTLLREVFPGQGLVTRCADISAAL